MGWSHSTSDKILEAFDLAFDDYGNLYLAGVFSASVDFNPQPSSTLLKTSNGSTDFFCLKVSANGSVKDVITLGGTLSDMAFSVVPINGQLQIGGVFSSSVDFDNSSSTSILTSNGSFDCFILSVDTGFNFNWAKSFGGSSTDFLYKSIWDKNQSIYNIGSIQGQADLDPDPTNTNILNNSSAGIYVQKLDLSGNLIWAQKFDGASTVRPYRIAEDSFKYLTIVGGFSGSIEVDPDPNITNTMLSSGATDAIVIRIDSLGNYVAAGSFGSSSDDILKTVFYNPNNNKFFAGGSFQNTIDIDPTPNTNLITSNGQEDMLFLELGLCTLQADTVAVVACNQFINPADSTVETTSGFYTANLLAADGCDSTIVFDVTINNIAPTVAQTIDGLVAQTQAPNPSYQWLNCSTGQPVPNATGQTFMPTTNGQYAVVVTSGNCTDTSACFAINNVAIAETSLPQLKLYPNPTTGTLSIESAQPWQRLEVVDLLGNIVGTSTKEELNLTHLPAGMYLVKVYFEAGVVVERVAKK